MASGFSGGSGGGSILGYSPAVSAWNFGSFALGYGGSLGSYIQEAQLDDFLYSFGGPQPKLQGISITASTELPGSTHWDPAPVSVGKPGGGSSPNDAVVLGAGVGLPDLGILGAILPDFENEGQPPIIFGGLPDILAGSGGGYYEPPYEEEGEEEVAITWASIGDAISTGIGLANQYGQMTSGQLQSAFVGPTGPAAPSVSVPTPGVPMVAGNCPPQKTRTLTIDCATGQEVKRKRRRRRALLTQGDMGVLFQIASLPNNANVRVALAGAIRR